MSRILDGFAKCLVGCSLTFAVFGPYNSANAKGKETVLHSFCSQAGCTDGENPAAGVIADSSGNLYGTTVSGGANGGGTVFEITSDGTYNVLYSFCSQQNCADGESPDAGLILDSSGNLYGTTTAGGTSANGNGTVFRLAADGTETVLYSFCPKRRCKDGSGPQAGLTMDSSGNLYGTTGQGGAKGLGTVFKLAADGNETVLYSFTGSSDGAYPVTNLILDSTGNLYGTTFAGAYGGGGIVYKVTSGGTFKRLYAFCSQPNCGDGSNPEGGVVMDSSSNLYGTTYYGGTYNYGTVFKLAASGTETVLYSFCSSDDCRDGAYPAAGLVMDGSGNLYGTTEFGVGRDCYDNYAVQDICGTAFKLGTNGTESVLYGFCSRADCADGLEPEGNLSMDSSGNLYGTTYIGGTGHCMYGCGTVFKLDPGRKKKYEIPVVATSQR